MKTELIRISTEKKRMLLAKSKQTGLSMVELLEYAQFPYVPFNKKVDKR